MAKPRKRKARRKSLTYPKGWVKSTTEVRDFRETLLETQDGCCAVTGETVVNPALDHAHLGSSDEGRCRGVLSGFVNIVEGRFRKDFMKFVNKHTNLSFEEFLINLGKYLSEDSKGYPLHYRTVEDRRKQITNWKKDTIIKRLKLDFGIYYLAKDGVILKTNAVGVLKTDLVDCYCQNLIELLTGC